MASDDSSGNVRAGSRRWSDQICTRYRCELPDDLRSWFDDEVWQAEGSVPGRRFDCPVSANDLLGDAPHQIWPALMPCDFLPIISNQMGDWLCIRFDNTSRVGQIVYWYHGGGDWIPWGTSLSEAILFDALRDRLPGSRRDHAVSTVDQAPVESRPTCLDQWALDHLHGVDASAFGLSGKELALAMLQNHLSVEAVRCHLVIDALHNPLLTDTVIESWPIHDADQIQQALFDNRLLTEELLLSPDAEHWSAEHSNGEQSSAEEVDVERLHAQQDWESARSNCQSVTEHSPELAWAWDLLGYCSERNGDLDSAFEYYRQGIRCSVFTDQTVRIRTHGFIGDGQKFSASRLMAHQYQPIEGEEADYFDCLKTKSADLRRDRVRDHFSKRAERAEPAEAHDLWVRAGWDLGAEPMLAFAKLLEKIGESAERAGRSAQGQLAKTHRDCFRDRYGA